MNVKNKAKYHISYGTFENGLFKASLSIRSSSFHKCPYLVFMTTIHGQVKVRISNMIQIQHTRELFAIFYIFFKHHSFYIIDILSGGKEWDATVTLTVFVTFPGCSPKLTCSQGPLPVGLLGN